ncbi:branched-chain amino acid transaminase [bacterium]|nr:branched-chain amino acid transaminase [bacterium]
MAFDENSKIWKNGEFINWKDATVHVASHVIHYGSSVFEGARCYKTKKGSAIFRITDHNQRLLNSAKIYRMEIPYSLEELNEACREVVRVNGYEEAYLRPIAYRGYGTLGVDPTSCPVEVAILTWKWGTYLGVEALENGVDVKIATWNRFAPNTMPTLAKAGANYMNSQLIKLEAKTDGYSEGIALTNRGTISEGSGENLFVISKGKIITPPSVDAILPGITRDSAIQIAHELGYEVIEQTIPREMLYIADELFFTGTAAEVTPVRSVDRIQIGKGKRGPITEKIQKRFFDILSGETEDQYGWLDYI